MTTAKAYTIPLFKKVLRELSGRECEWASGAKIHHVSHSQHESECFLPARNYCYQIPSEALSACRGPRKQILPGVLDMVFITILEDWVAIWNQILLVLRFHIWHITTQNKRKLNTLACLYRILSLRPSIILLIFSGDIYNESNAFAHSWIKLGF